MDRQVQDGGVVLEDVLRAIAMVDVPVEDDNLLSARSLGCPSSHSRIIEEAEAHCHVALGMMPWRPHNGCPMQSFPPAFDSDLTDFLPMPIDTVVDESFECQEG